MPGIPSIQSAVSIGTLPNGPGILARDLGFNAVAAGQVRYGFGDTLGPWNPDGTLPSNSGATAAAATPLVATSVAGGVQMIPCTPDEAAWNLAGPAAHPYRIGLPIMGVVVTLVSPNAVRVFYAVDQPTYSAAPGEFYDAFPMKKLGTTLWYTGDNTLARDAASEWEIPETSLWPVGFHPLLDGSVRFYLQDVHDDASTSSFYRARWMPTGVVILDSTPAFQLDAVLGLHPWWHSGRGQFLATYIDQCGRLRVTALDAATALPLPGDAAIIASIPDWATPWNGYAAVPIQAANTKKTFDVLYSRVTGIFTSDMPVTRVTMI